MFSYSRLHIASTDCSPLIFIVLRSLSLLHFHGIDESEFSLYRSFVVAGCGKVNTLRFRAVEQNKKTKIKVKYLIRERIELIVEGRKIH